MALPDQTASQWLQGAFTSLYESAPPAEVSDFEALFLFTFSEEAEIILNHEKVPLETFQLGLSKANFAISRASVEWKEVIEVPPKDGGTDPEVIVAGFFVVTRSMKFRIRAGPAQRLSYNSFSAKFAGPPDAEGSRRRIAQLVITTLDVAAPIHLQGIPHAESANQGIDPALLQKRMEL
ncbi:hypothetical protein GALMADRAFT_80058 [Galerina marginata CBS 339.88]|uniref:NTF2 domain-containing protein n=1 Tax=Galerina marginata (strain CBS 339.88) TaxID=685588 RepID=A0A067SB58_GALM3|nr:hypothetical protein GALMADRAFT_80058 [Galerina marginata CBS 339.88]